jgi:hypothetical protein
MLFIAIARAEKKEIQPDLLLVIVDDIGFASLAGGCESGKGETAVAIRFKGSSFWLSSDCTFPSPSVTI